MNSMSAPYSITQFKVYEDYLDSKLTEMDLVHLKVSSWPFSFFSFLSQNNCIMECFELQESTLEF